MKFKSHQTQQDICHQNLSLSDTSVLAGVVTLHEVAVYAWLLESFEALSVHVLTFLHFSGSWLC